MNKPIYIHYGSTQFNPAKGFPIKNEANWSKPIGGLWASRKNATFGWKEWCAAEEFRECTDDNSFDFVIKDGFNVATVSNLLQLQPLPRIETTLPVFGSPIRDSHIYNIDFEKCVQTGIDAIELCWYGDEFGSNWGYDLHFALLGWDCDSIVVLNPHAVIPLAANTN